MVIDDPFLFPNVARILDAMLRRIDPANPILVQYLASININVTVGVIFPKGIEDSSKAVKAQKKKKKTEQPKPIQEHVEKEVSQSVQENVENEVSKEVIPLKTGFLKHTNKPAKRHQHSPIRPSVPEVEVETPTKS